VEERGIKMANPFETVILNMRQTGMFQFLLPFMLSSAIFYGLLRKSQIFGDPQRSVTINAVVALVAAFMVWASPILLGINIETMLAAFFLQGVSATLVILVGLIIVSMFFPPDLATQIGKALNTKTAVGGLLIFGILIAVAVLFSSGLINIFIPKDLTAGLGAGLSGDVIMSIVMVALLLGTVLVIVWGGGGEKKSS
jgi:MFS family permease